MVVVGLLGSAQPQSTKGAIWLNSRLLLEQQSRLAQIRAKRDTELVMSLRWLLWRSVEALEEGEEARLGCDNRTRSPGSSASVDSGRMKRMKARTAQVMPLSQLLVASKLKRRLDL